jgi:molecular chaperone IbpA
MTKTALSFPKIFDDFGKFGVGFDDLFNKINSFHEEAAKNIPNYPPYNIKKTDENTYVIEMAVAGFSKQDITVELEGDKLVVKGNIEQSEETAMPLYQGLAFRPFTRYFTLNDQVEVKNAEMVNGLLRIALERIVQVTKAQQIEIK